MDEARLFFNTELEYYLLYLFSYIPFSFLGHTQK